MRSRGAAPTSRPALTTLITSPNSQPESCTGSGLGIGFAGGCWRFDFNARLSERGGSFTAERAAVPFFQIEVIVDDAQRDGLYPRVKAAVLPLRPG